MSEHLCIPYELFRRGRPVDHLIDPEEELYIRFEEVTKGFVELGCIKCPDQSVNRSKYSRPEHVLLPNFFNLGYGSIKSSDIHEVVETPPGEPRYFRSEHDPLEDNYSHAEIRAYKENEHKNRVTKIGSRILRTKFKSILQKKIKIIKMPDYE
ncbi:MAG: hypothetical protein HQK57_16745 [Deltaproteobacteria bacterium]|nr:hypothetical protein [Deltaproteobacteria bacterium]